MHKQFLRQLQRERYTVEDYLPRGNIMQLGPKNTRQLIIDKFERRSGSKAQDLDCSIRR